MDLRLAKTVTRETFGTWSDYSLYSGVTLTGWPVMTMVRGRLSRDGVVVAPPGNGRFVAGRQPTGGGIPGVRRPKETP